jgi:hypothetical protein
MDETLKYIKKFVKKHKGELVIDGFSIVMLEGYRDIPEDDYYWELFKIRTGRYLSSCVGGLIPLKGVLSDEDYNEIKRAFDLNKKFWE